MATPMIQTYDYDLQPGVADVQVNVAQPSRLLSLDGLRGFDMFWIIGGQEIVRSLARVWPGKVSDAIARQLEHVPWQGLHFFDVIWTLFMFMVGVSLAFSIAKRKSLNESHRSIYSHALRRAAILFIL